jgi:hypothetical protein
MKNFDNLFRVALLVILVAGLILATWHISWVHSHAAARYEISSPDYIHVFVLDRQERVIYSGAPGRDWQTTPLPKEP